MAERLIEIVIKGKNLTGADFAAARKELSGLKDGADKATFATTALGSAFRLAGTAFAGFSFFNMAKDVLNYADNIEDLASQTGLSMRAIQEMSYAAKLTGSTLDNFTNAAFKLGTIIAGGDSSVQAGVKRLGLSYAELRQASPEQQFDMVARALLTVENQQERNRLGVLLMGKGYKEVAGAVNESYDELKKGARAVTDEQIKALADARREIDEFSASLMQMGLRLGASFAKAMKANGEALRQDAEFLNKYVGVVRITQGAVEDWGTIFGTAAKAPAVFGAAVKDLPQQLGSVNISVDDQEKRMKALEQQHARTARSTKQLTSAQEETDPAIQRLTESYRAQIAAFQRGNTIAGSVLDSFRLMRVELEGIGPIQTKSLHDTAAAQEAARKWAMENGAVLAPSIRNVSAALQVGNEDIKGWGASITNTMRQVPQMLQQAFTGGGGMGGAMKALGSSFGADLFNDKDGVIGKKIAGGLSKILPGALGNAFSAALPGVGAMLGPLIGKIGNLFTDKNKQQVAQYNGEIKKVQDSLLQQYGTMGDLEAAAKRVGLSFADAWGHQGKAGLDAFNQVAKEFKQRTEELNAKLAEGSTKLGGLLTSSRDLGRSLPQALRDSINGLIELGLLTGDVAAQFKSLGNESGVDFKKMQEAAQRYGVDLGALGPQFQSARLHASAVEIINDFDLLTAGGADVGGVLAGMKDEISALVRDSIQFGTTIPANMQPWVNELFRTGQLTDANGQKMTDISALKFSDPIKTQWEVITSSLQEVVMSLRDIASSIGQIPTNKTLTISTNYVDDGPPQGFGDPNGSRRFGGDEPGFARGTFGATGSDFPDFGSGTRAVLHGREAVVPEGDRVPFAMRTLAAAGLAGVMASSQPVIVNNYIVNDFTGARTVTESEFKQFQARLDGGGLQVPARAISSRGR